MACDFPGAHLAPSQPFGHPQPCHGRLLGGPFKGGPQDWTEKANAAFRVCPRVIKRTGAVAQNPHKRTSKYWSVALSAYDMGTHEGVNEKGLSAHSLYLPVENSFDPRDPKQEGIGIMQ